MLKISSSLHLPADAMTLTSAVLGIRGSGKTNSAVVFTEELLDQGQQVIIVDPLDVWWGLKSSGDGAAPGYSVVVLGGNHGDLPLGEHDGRVLADFLVENRVPAILSLRHLRKSEQRRFVADFAEQLYRRKGETGHNTPLLVVIDEASSFVPQSFQADSARMVGAIEDLVRRGRASGIGVMLIDQRAASVNKDVLTQLELLVAHRHTSPQDRAALKLWVQAHDTGGQEKTFLDSLASLPRGEAWFWSPGWLDLFQRVLVRQRRTFDSSATPELGKAPPVPQKLAPVDLALLRDKLSATLDESAQNDPQQLRKRIAELEKQLGDALANTKPCDKLHIETEQLERIANMAGWVLVSCRDIGMAGNNLLRLVDELGGAKNENSTSHELPDEVTTVAKSTLPEQVSQSMQPRAITKAKPSAKKNHGAAVSPSHQRVLDAVAFLEGVGICPARRVHVAFMAGYTENGHFNNMVGTLKNSGLLEYPVGGMVELTDKGRAVADPDMQPITTLPELHRAVLDKLTPSKAKLLRVLIDEYPSAVARRDLAGRTGYTENGHFNNMLGELKKLGVAEYPRGGFVAATDVLFPTGLT